MIGRDGYGSFLRFYSLFGENEKVKIKKNKRKKTLAIAGVRFIDCYQ